MNAVFQDKKIRNDPTEVFGSLPPEINVLSEIFKIISGKIL